MSRVCQKAKRRRLLSADGDGGEGGMLLLSIWFNLRYACSAWIKR